MRADHAVCRSKSMRATPIAQPEERVMRRLLILVLSGTLAALAAISVSAASLRTDHPIIGTWKIELPDSSCHEVYHIRRDGTMIVTSAEEISESEFTISD